MSYCVVFPIVSPGVGPRIHFLCGGINFHSQSESFIYTGFQSNSVKEPKKVQQDVVLVVAYIFVSSHFWIWQDVINNPRMVTNVLIAWTYSFDIPLILSKSFKSMATAPPKYVRYGIL